MTDILLPLGIGVALGLLALALAPWPTPKASWHFVVCRPWFSSRDAFTGPLGQLLNGQGICDCGKILRRRNK